MDIAQYIADLLKEKDEVGVPSFGTFYTKHANAFFDQDSNSFVPPGRELFFKTEETDPSLLISYISKVKNLSRPSSKNFAEKFGETLKTEINLVGKAEVLPLGSFEKLAEVFAFTPTPEFKHINNFGLLPVEELSTKLPQSVANAISDANRSTVAESKAESEDNLLTARQQEPAKEPSPIIETPVNTTQEVPEKAMPLEREPSPAGTRKRDTNPPIQEEYYTAEVPRKRNGWLVALALFTVLIAVGIIAYINYPDAFSFLQNNNAATVADTQIIPVAKEKPIADTLALADTLSQPDSIKTNSGQQESATTTATDTIVTSQEATIPHTEVISYEIIGASLQTKKEAENYIRAMKAKGINARIVENKPGRYIKVSIGSFTDPAKRDAELVRIKKDINKNAWPLDVKIKR